MMFPKFTYLRDKKHLKRVAALPCQICGAPAPSQASHSNQAIHGKGRGIKASDEFTAALCPNCHYEIDQGNKLTKNEKIAWWNEAFEKTTSAMNITRFTND